MAQIAKNPIKTCEIGLPCMLGKAVGRIVGESEKGSCGEINGKRIFSIKRLTRYGRRKVR